MVVMDFAFGALASFVANFLSALAGGGSGLFLLPALLFLGMPFQTALASHKIATVGLGVGGSIRHGREGLVSKKLCLILLLASSPGVIVGALTATSIPEEVARLALGILILGLALLSGKLTPSESTPMSKRSKHVFWLVGCFGVFIIGLLNGALSSGTGLLFTYWMAVWFRRPLTEALSYTMIVCSFANNLLGAVVLGLQVSVQWGFVAALILGALIGGYAGSSLSLAKGSNFIRRVFRISCAVIGSSLIYSML